MSNPYDSPQGNFAPQYPPPNQGGFHPGGQRLGDSTYVRQVMVICILNFVQAALEIFLGGLLVLGGTFFAQFFDAFAQDPNAQGWQGQGWQGPQGQQGPQGWQGPQGQQGQQGPPPEVAEMFDIVTTVYIVAGVVLIGVAVLRILAGIANLKFRGRGFGIASMIIGVLPILTIYCAPTSIGLIIYGLIIYLNRDSARAFQLGSQGYTRDQVLAAPLHG